MGALHIVLGLICVALTLVWVAMLTQTVIRMVRTVRLGQPDPTRNGPVGPRLKNMLKEILGQRRGEFHFAFHEAREQLLHLFDDGVEIEAFQLRSLLAVEGHQLADQGCGRCALFKDLLKLDLRVRRHLRILEQIFSHQKNHRKDVVELVGHGADQFTEGGHALSVGRGDLVQPVDEARDLAALIEDRYVA